MQIEPTLIPLSGEAQFYRSANVSPDARLDVSARGFWGDRFSRTMFDVRVFHPSAPSSRSASVTSQFVKHEKAKRRQYEQRVRDVEGASFVPLVFSTSGGMARAAVLTFKRLASLLSEKLGLSYSATVNVVRCRHYRLRFCVRPSLLSVDHAGGFLAPTSSLRLHLLRQGWRPRAVLTTLSRYFSLFPPLYLSHDLCLLVSFFTFLEES